MIDLTKKNSKAYRKKDNKVIRKNKIKESLFILSLLAYPLLQFIVFYVLVNANSIAMAFQKIDKNNAITFIGFDNFVTFFKSLVDNGSVVAQAAKNSAIGYLCTLIISFPFQLFVSYYIFKKFALSSVFRVIIMLPSIISGMLMALVFQKFIYALPSALENIGITNFPKFLSDDKYILGTVIFYGIWTSLGGTVIMYTNAMVNIDHEILESGQLDGATLLQEFIHLVIPLIMPTITTFIVSGVSGLITYSGALYTFYGEGAPYSAMTMGYYLTVKVLKSGDSYMQFPILAAQGIVLTLIAFPLTMITKKVMEKLDPMND